MIGLTPAAAKPVMNETRGNGRGWRILRRMLVGLAVFATLIAMFYTEEDWRGKRAWENYRRELEAKGEKLDWQAFVPAPVPEDQNFFEAPIFQKLASGEISMNFERSDGIEASLRKGSGNWLRGTATDLKGWQIYYRNPTKPATAKEFPIAPQMQTPAADVLYALNKYDAAMEQLRQASRRPYANLPLNYADGFNAVSPLLPDLATLKRCARVLSLRAVAELADGQSDQALEDIKLLLYLDNSIRNSPFLISQLVRIAMASIALQPVWEGLSEHKWSDEQLAALDSELSKMDFLADYEFAMRGDRAFAIASFENQRRTRETVAYTGDRLVTNKLTLMPSAFFYRNELEFARLQQQWILPIVDTHSRTVSPAACRRLEADVAAESKHYSLYKVQALASVPAVAASAEKFAFIQWALDAARVACALERYRLAHGEYPDTLDALAPQFIAAVPHDNINGQPLHYRRTDDGKFVLYSVGWNEKDDGGQVAFKKGGVMPDQDNGDWVWKN